MNAAGTTSPPTPAAPPTPAGSPTTTSAPAPPPPEPVKRCLDCGAALNGKFCSACGQRAQLRSLSLRTLTHDAFHDLAHLDSRVWRTLRALLLRPGFLTNEFLAGRRTRYLPPFRLYLVLSVIYFVLPSCAPEDQALDLGGTVVAADANCQNASWGLPGRAWMEPLITSSCERLKTVSKREFGRALADNVPKMMFLFLPLLALVNLVLYTFRRRKYVEHLLFYVHFHAFAFLLLTVQVLLVAALQAAGLSGMAELVTFATIILLFVTLFKAMRAVYRQSRAMTSLKYFVVLSSYGLFSLLTLIGTMLYTAVTV